MLQWQSYRILVRQTLSSHSCFYRVFCCVPLDEYLTSLSFSVIICKMKLQSCKNYTDKVWSVQCRARHSRCTINVSAFSLPTSAYQDINSPSNPFLAGNCITPLNFHGILFVVLLRYSSYFRCVHLKCPQRWKCYTVADQTTQVF